MKKIAIIGMGTMGSAISELLQDTFVVAGILRGGSLAAVSDADIVLLAVKPQQFAALADKLREHIGSQMIISIMAGVILDSLCGSLGTENVVRTMPNLGLRRGQSLTAWLSVEGADAGLAEAVVGIWGASVRLDNEAQFDAFTALAGSGPAYYFELARATETVARELGFSAEQARLIATQTFLSAASAVGLEADFTALTQSVASKGGTTEAALDVFAQEGFTDTIRHAINTAAARSCELGSR